MTGYPRKGESEALSLEQQTSSNTWAPEQPWSLPPPVSRRGGNGPSTGGKEEGWRGSPGKGPGPEPATNGAGIRRSPPPLGPGGPGSFAGVLAGPG